MASDIHNTVKMSKVHLTGVPADEERETTETIFGKIIARNFQ